MPNLCYNKIVITGPSNQIDDLMYKSDVENEFSFEGICPPKLDERSPEPFDFKILDKSEESIIIEFKTAWSPPVFWLEESKKKYKDLNFNLEYEEEFDDQIYYMTF